MKRLMMAVCSAVLAIPGTALACGHQMDAEQSIQPKPAVRQVSVTEVAALRTANKAQIVDANSSKTRGKFGVIPGAVMLTSVTQFDPAKELPANKDAKLVFYCANLMCHASTIAAERAAMAGYTDVNVMPAGIIGWKEAGQATASALSRI